MFFLNIFIASNVGALAPKGPVSKHQRAKTECMYTVIASQFGALVPKGAVS